MIIDSHAHCFPDALAPRAIAKLAPDYNPTPIFDGTVDGLLAALDRDGIDRCFVLNVATNAHQQDKVNAFAAQINRYRDRIYAFGSLHPDHPDVMGAAKRMKEAGLFGVKIHPDFLGMEIDDRRMDPVFAACCEYGLPLVIHSGYDPAYASHIHAKPQTTANVLARFPALRLCCAHFGDAKDPEAVLKYLCGKNVWFDTGFTGLGLSPQDARRILDNHDENKVMFGTDLPWEAPSVTLRYLRSLSLSEERLEKIYHTNAEAFLKM